MKIKECLRCGKKKDWNGDDMNCPFQNSDIFNEDNWNCGIIDKIRDLCDLAASDEYYGLHYEYCDDQKFVAINIHDIKLDDDHIGECLWVSWYKSRGGTDAIWVLSHCGPPRKPTYGELKTIAGKFKKEGVENFS